MICAKCINTFCLDLHPSLPPDCLLLHIILHTYFHCFGHTELSVIVGREGLTVTIRAELAIHYSEVYIRRADQQEPLKTTLNYNPRSRFLPLWRASIKAYHLLFNLHENTDFAVVYSQHGTHVKRVNMCRINVFSLSKRGTLDQKIGTGEMFGLKNN